MKLTSCMDRTNLDVLALVDQIESLALEHCDEDAEDSDTSPQDMHAHRNGLILKRCRKIKELLK